VELFGIRFVGLTAENGRKLVLTLVLFLLIWLLRQILRVAIRAFQRVRTDERAEFWTRQGINLGLTLLTIIGLLSIWFSDPTRLATALGLITAGLAFALQRVITSVAGYFVILRGNTFSIGDRISMGGVRGDVIALGLIQTTIMEMGEPPNAQGGTSTWVRGRQYSGRIVTVSNAKIFDDPVYNYTRDFPYIWEELSIQLPYAADRVLAEQILLDAAQRHTGDISERARTAVTRLGLLFPVQHATTEPRVYYTLGTDRLELTLRFMTDARAERDVKDAISRDLLHAFDAAGIALTPEPVTP
jgi:small-conductance mechanosensitive channel